MKHINKYQIIAATLVTAAMFATSIAAAQQYPIFSQYINNISLINPAYAGYTHDVNTVITYRNQWAGFDGSPQTFTGTGHMSFLNNKAAAGLSVLSDKIGSNNTSELQMMYAYHLPLTSDWTMSFGLQGGATNYRSDYSDLTINPNDPKFGPVNVWMPTLGAGFMLYQDNLMLSVSMPKMLSAKSGYDSLGVAYYSRQLSTLASYVFQLTPRIKLKPYALARVQKDVPFSADLGAIIKIDDSYNLGVFTSNLNSFGITALLHIGDVLRVGYTFEVPTGKSVGLNFQTHEVFLGMRFVALRYHDVLAVRNF